MSLSKRPAEYMQNVSDRISKQVYQKVQEYKASYERKPMNESGNRYYYKPDRLGNFLVVDTKTKKDIYLQGDDANSFGSDLKKWEKKKGKDSFDSFMSTHDYDSLLEMEELPDQKKYTSRKEIEDASRSVDVKDADGTNYDEWDAQRSASGKENTLLKFQNDNEDGDSEEEIEESILDRILRLREEKLRKTDPVGHADDDINNDGEVDDEDEYLKKRRKAIKKDMKESTGSALTEDKHATLNDLKKIAKGDEDEVEITLGDDEPFEIDSDVAKAIVDKASSRDIKKALGDYEAMIELIDKVLR